MSLFPIEQNNSKKKKTILEFLIDYFLVPILILIGLVGLATFMLLTSWTTALLFKSDYQVLIKVWSAFYTLLCSILEYILVVPFITIKNLCLNFVKIWPLQQWIWFLGGLIAFYIGVWKLFNYSRWIKMIGKLTRNNIIFLMFLDFAIKLVIGMVCMHPALRNTSFGVFMLAISPMIFMIEISLMYWSVKHFLNKGYLRDAELYLIFWGSPRESLFILVTFAIRDKIYPYVKPEKKQ